MHPGPAEAVFGDRITPSPSAVVRSPTTGRPRRGADPARDIPSAALPSADCLFRTRFSGGRRQTAAKPRGRHNPSTSAMVI
jgi:hypothetical protein